MNFPTIARKQTRGQKNLLPNNLQVLKVYFYFALERKETFLNFSQNGIVSKYLLSEQKGHFFQLSSFTFSLFLSLSPFSSDKKDLELKNFPSETLSKPVYVCEMFFLQ